jgi:alginate O-acetyltransferase complex protein AlgI
MQPRRFLPENVPTKDDVRPTLGGVLTNVVAGLVFLKLIPWLMPASAPFFLRVWSGLIGAALLNLFVRFDIAVALFRWLGFKVERLWNCPGAATSVADFWGQRWNLVMSGLGREAIFMPLARRAGGTVALAAVFVYSGLVHEAVSFGARGGYGGPTAYFLIQGAGIWLEGRRWARRLTRARPWLGRVWAALVVVGPLGLMLHRPCMDAIVVRLLRYMDVPGV